MTSALYLDTSAVLRAVLETGAPPEIEARLRAATVLVTSRLSPVLLSGRPATDGRLGLTT